MILLYYSILLYSFTSFKISPLMNEKWAVGSQSGMKPLSQMVPEAIEA